MFRKSRRSRRDRGHDKKARRRRKLPTRDHPAVGRYETRGR